MKVRINLFGVYMSGIVMLLILAAVLYLHFGGITHEGICQEVARESGTLQKHIDLRYQAIDEKLDRLEGKLDRLLKIAERPAPDGLEPVR